MPFAAVAGRDSGGIEAVTSLLRDVITRDVIVAGKRADTVGEFSSAVNDLEDEEDRNPSEAVIPGRRGPRRIRQQYPSH